MNQDNQHPADPHVQRALDEIFGKADREHKREVMRDILLVIGRIVTISILWIALLRIIGRVDYELNGRLYLVLLIATVFIAIAVEKFLFLFSFWISWWLVEKREWKEWCETASIRDVTAWRTFITASKEVPTDPIAQITFDLKMVDDPVLARGREIESQRLNQSVRHHFLANMTVSVFILLLTFL